MLPAISGRAPAVERALFWRIDTPTRQQRAVRRGDWKLMVDGDDLRPHRDVACGVGS
ncbi:MAG: hypothetical protein ABIW79_07950 [Gemmatimonas sp.]